MASWTTVPHMWDKLCEPWTFVWLLWVTACSCIQRISLLSQGACQYPLLWLHTRAWGCVYTHECHLPTLTIAIYELVICSSSIVIASCLVKGRTSDSCPETCVLSHSQVKWLEYCSALTQSGRDLVFGLATIANEMLLDRKEFLLHEV